MNQSPLSCAKTSFPAPKRMRFLSPSPHQLMFKVYRVESYRATVPLIPTPLPPLASAGKEGLKSLHPANLPPCIERREKFYPEPLGHIPLSPSQKSPCVTGTHHLQGESSHLNPREKDTREAGRSSPNLYWGGQSVWRGDIWRHREKREREGNG